MKVILTAKEPIVGKDKREWVKASYIDTKGVSGEIFLSKEKFDEAKIRDDRFLSTEILNELVTTVKLVDVEFDRRGRVVSIS